MILPEIEEEVELPEEKKLSLTSLLLGQQGGPEYASPMVGYDRSPAVTHRVGALRSNGHPPSGSWRNGGSGRSLEGMGERGVGDVGGGGDDAEGFPANYEYEQARLPAPRYTKI